MDGKYFSPILMYIYTICGGPYVILIQVDSSLLGNHYREEYKIRYLDVSSPVGIRAMCFEKG